MFAPELASIDRIEGEPRSAAAVAGAVDAVACFEAWDLLVNERGLDRTEVERLWSIAVTALLGGV